MGWHIQRMIQHERFGVLILDFLTFTIDASSILLAMKHSRAVLFFVSYRHWPSQANSHL